MSDFLLKFVGVVIGWAGVVAVAYMTILWCFDYKMSWKKAGLWAASTLIGIILSIGMYYLLPQRIQDVFNVLFDHLICGAALQILLLRIDDYLITINGIGISRSKLYLGILIIYSLMILDGLLVIQMNSHTIVTIADMVIAYLTRAAILLCLALEIKLRNQPKPESSMQNYDMEDY